MKVRGGALINVGVASSTAFMEGSEFESDESDVTSDLNEDTARILSDEVERSSDITDQSDAEEDQERDNVISDQSEAEEDQERDDVISDQSDGEMEQEESAVITLPPSLKENVEKGKAARKQLSKSQQ